MVITILENHSYEVDKHWIIRDERMEGPTASDQGPNKCLHFNIPSRRTGFSNQLHVKVYFLYILLTEILKSLY